jgi:hypothetical protein
MRFWSRGLFLLSVCSLSFSSFSFFRALTNDLLDDVTVGLPVLGKEVGGLHGALGSGVESEGVCVSALVEGGASE